MGSELIEEVPLESRRLVTMNELAYLLAYSSVKTLRQAMARNKVSITVFQIPGRRGLFTRRDYVAAYLSNIEANKM